MKLAVLSDIHANLRALERVLEDIDCWKPDAVVVAGDVVNRGPQPLACLQLILERQARDGWHLVRGNHEDYVIAQSKPDSPRSGPLGEIFRSSLWTYRQLNCDVQALEAMPFQQSLPTPNGHEVRITHASTRGNRDGIYPTTDDISLRKQIGRPVVPLFVVGHTHWPLVRQVDETLVVNVGAAGLPFDGDQRVSYGQMTWHMNGWQARIVRLEYNLQLAERDFFDTGFLEDGGPLARLMRIELLEARSQLYQWAVAYQDAVMAGELTLAESVERVLAQ
ncbi:MAG: metallophosphoesterase family protein [Chloroflexota bacterium]|nr:metallophosphoesterase family protein [Chloroflexota bacterium]